MKLITTLLIASTLAANANWFTNIFESESDRANRVYLETIEKEHQEELFRAEMQASYFEHRRECIQLARKVYGNGNLDQLEILGDQLLEAHPELHQVKARPTEAQPYVPTYVPTVKPEMNDFDKKFVKDSLANLGF